jgi:SAM-dependent methyltransferase
MDELSKEYVISFYNNTLQLHGDRPEAVRWTSSGQAEHYRCLLEISKRIDGKKILDYGCGKGDFYQFLKENNLSVHYTGFDINEGLISLAKRKFPECVFKVFDIECDPLDENFDYIFLCGVYNLKVQGLRETIENTLKKLFNHCRIAMAFNGLSMHSPKKDFELNYISPENLFGFAVKNLSPYVTLRHDTIPYDFTIFVYKENKLKEE